MSADRRPGMLGRLLRSLRPDSGRPDSGPGAGNQTVRRLAAILSADMVGYSRLIGLDEEGTLAALRTLRRELINPKIAAHRGNIIKATGDGLLVEFPSVVDAMRCAVEVQHAMAAHVSDAAPGRRTEFRIGVNIGDIVFEDGDIYGDGVNVASRLEQLAAPGGICVSQMVYKECAGKIDGAFDGGFTDGGERELKNIAQPVHVWHWRPDASAAVAAAAIPQFIESFEGKPSIAVLPFLNMSEDKSQEYFADGMTEDIITGLSCDSRLFVIARNSTFAYKGLSPDIRTAGKELGVRYVLEGSIRPIGERLRITVQLIETATGAHVWAEKIDRPAAEIFDVMDEVVDGLVIALCSNLGVTEARRAGRQRPEDLQAWALCVQAEVLYLTQPDSKNVLEAENLAKRATEIEPGYAFGWAFLAAMTGVRIPFLLSGDLAADSEKILSRISRALRLAPNDPVVLSYCGFAALWAGRSTQAVDYLERSLAINPSSSSCRHNLGMALSLDGRSGDGATLLRAFINRSPNDPYIGLAYAFLTWCHLGLNDLQQAEQSALMHIRHLPGNAYGHLQLAMSLAGQGRDDEARQQIQKMLQIEPEFTLQALEDFWRHVTRKPEDAEQFIALIRRAWNA